MGSVANGEPLVIYSVITPTLQRDSLIQCCRSVEEQSLIHWQHIVVIDGGPFNPDLMDAIAHPQRRFIHLPKRSNNFGNHPRHEGWKLAVSDYVLYLDDDNFFAHKNALRDIDNSLADASDPHWAVFPILRFGQRFFSNDPRCCHVDTGNMVIQREIAQWPDRDEYTLDGIFCEELKAKYSYVAFPDVEPIIVVPVQGKGL